jgi:hypothetical protein
MDEFERKVGRRTKVKELLDQYTEELSVIQTGLSKAREAISAMTTKQLVASPEK